MTSQQVYQGIRSFISNHDHKFQNVYVYDWECDSFSVTSTGYVYEIEVKVSRSDFMADFKKPKHHFFKTMKNGYSILAGDVSWISERDGNTYIRREFQHIKPMMVGYENCPNRFFFACPVGLCKRYALEVAKASLKKASENAYAFIDEDLKGDCFPVIVKSSIDNESNIVL